MTAIQFATWLKGFAEGSDPRNITPLQWSIVREKLDEVEEPKDRPQYYSPSWDSTVTGVPVDDSKIISTTTQILKG